MDFPWLGLRKKKWPASSGRFEIKLSSYYWEEILLELRSFFPTVCKRIVYILEVVKRDFSNSSFNDWEYHGPAVVWGSIADSMIRWYAPRPHVDTLLGLAIGYESPVVNHEMTEIGLRTYTSCKIGLCFTLIFLFVSVSYNHILFICGCE